MNYAMSIKNRKLIISSLLIANCGLITLPWCFALVAISLAIFNLIKTHDCLFSALIIMTAVISAIIGSLMPAITINLHNLTISAIHIENLKIVTLIMIVPLFINLLFISSFDETHIIIENQA